MELVVIDLTSPIFIVIALVIIEVSYCYPVGQLLKNKDKTEVVVQNIISMLEDQSESKVQLLYSDNSFEFVNAVID